MFLGRGNELLSLENIYNTKSFQMVILYGRRRVGKSTLITHFTRDKPAIVFSAIESDGKRNLELFSKAVMSANNVYADVSFPAWEKAFEYVADLAKKQLILVIDEYPYLAQAERSISSLLQNYCDTIFKHTQLMIILCGSSMSFMENQVLGYQSPLYGRRTAQMKINPFGYREASLFVPKYSIEQKAIVYGLTGGVPKYLELFDDSISLKQNIIKNFLTSTGYLYEEPSNLLKQELREPAKYNVIIEAVATGSSRLNEIATKTGLDTSAVSIYINSLISLGIMQKEIPITEEKNKRKTLYRLADTMFAFWYRHVLGKDFSITSGDAESLYENEIKDDLNRFMGPIFERMCAEYLAAVNIKKNGNLPLKIRQLGRWWGTNPETKAAEEIDLVGINDKESSILFCECKYRNQMTDIDVLNDLIKKSQAWKGFKHSYFMLFSKSGFTKRLVSVAKEKENVRLISLQDMY